MRDIKFRAKYLSNGKWFYWDLWTDISEELIKKETIGQYTGLKDKNGVEIYEGDIVEERDEAPMEIIFGEAVLEGSIDDFSFNGFYAKQEKHNTKKVLYPNNYPLTGDFAETLEVIGNIYEHPLLIEN